MPVKTQYRLREKVVVFCRLCFVLLGMSGLMLFSPSGIADSQPAKELRLLRAELSKLKTRLERTVGKRDREAESLHEIEQAIIAQTQEIEDSAKKLNEIDQQIKQNQQREQDLQVDIQRQRTEVVELVRTSYSMGRHSYLKLLLNQQNPAQVDRTMAYYRYFARARQEKMANLRASIAEATEIKQQLNDQSNRLGAIQDNLQQQRQKMQALRQSRKTQLAKLNRDINDQKPRLSRLENDERRLLQLIQALAKRKQAARKSPAARDPVEPGMNATAQKLSLAKPASNQPFTSLRGQLALPLKGTIRARYGQTREDSGLRWEGVMFKADDGAAVRAIYDGTVSYADWLRGFGLLLIIDHGDGYMSLYSHNKKLHKAPGEAVSTGEMIANAGDTGGLAEPGLYFEIRHNGEPRDPLTWCKRS